MATYYAINAGGNWSAGGTWSTIAAKDASRVGGATAPTNADTCILDDYSGSVTVDTATCTCKILTCTGHTGTLTFTAGQKLTIATAGSVTFAATMALTGTGTLDCLGTVSLTSGGLTFPGALTFTTSGTKTLVDNWTVTGLFTSATTTQTINKTGVGAGDTLTLNGGMTITGSTGGSGTTKLVLGGGTWSGSGTLGNSLTFNGNCTISGSVAYTAGTMLYTSGTITTTGSTVTISGAPSTLTTDAGGGNKITFNILKIATCTLGSDITCATLWPITSPTMSGAYDIHCTNFYYYYVGTAPLTFTLMEGQNLNVSTTMRLESSVGCAVSLVSKTASTHTHLNYSGSAADCQIYGVVFTDIDASGSSIPLDNWYGGTLTRTVNIYNRTSDDIGEDIIRGGTTIIINADKNEKNTKKLITKAKFKGRV